MFPTGQKRKSPGEDEEMSDENGPEWESQRQVVFSMSMIKYQHSQELVEPNLRRVVLITNTLRQLDLQGCGEALAGAEGSNLPSMSVDGASDSSGRCKERNLASCQSGVAPAGGDEDWASMSTEPDFEVETAIASILCTLDSIDGGPQAALRSPLRSLENLTEGGASWEKQEPQAYLENWERQPEASGEAVPSYLSEVTVEDLFQDIDTSLLDSDIELLGLRGATFGHSAGEELLRYLPPFAPSSDSFAITLNQNLKCLPAFSSFIPASSSSSPTLFTAQNHLREGFELEHLMEVLVES